ncbi:hypothetical protein niasHT_029511 [Heterodera trifolii]|uniref:CBF1-interacting co-repressor CIR N-terminal domain-containing protein n=1 Tax=Heterodera trifolii TaxID=157864 RepID=A0ABD2JAZ6_9BILA
MNILRHKKWHVRTKENVARVRRDEAKAAEEERARSERAALAEHEDRVRRLKTRASTAAVASAGDIFGGGAGNELAATSASSAATVGAAAGHVNLFAELEEQERTNTVVGNREYAAERKKEQDDWESKVGIMKRFAEDTKEYAKESEWWQGIPLVREKVEKKTAAEDNKLETNKSKGGGQTKFMTEEEKRTLKKMRKKKDRKERRKEKKKKKRKRHHSSSSAQSSSTDSETEQRRKATKLDELRRERMVRERQEQAKTKQLFVKPEPKDEKVVTVESQAEDDRQRRYNTQFNPDLARSC